MFTNYQNKQHEHRNNYRKKETRIVEVYFGGYICPYKRNKFSKAGLGSVRRDWNVLRAVRRFRGQSLGPSWEEYVRSTQRGRVRYSGKK